MRTLGIDLAAQEKKTASCAIEWISGRALVELPVVGAPTTELITAMQAAQWIGIDAPFGWPDAMVEAIHRYAHEGTWPDGAVSERLRYRVTDWFVHEVIAPERDLSIWPLSVSSDRIAVCAWPCANLLREFGTQTGWQLDRIGTATVRRLHLEPRRLRRGDRQDAATASRGIRGRIDPGAPSSPTTNSAGRLDEVGKKLTFAGAFTAPQIQRSSPMCVDMRRFIVDLGTSDEKCPVLARQLEIAACH